MSFTEKKIYKFPSDISVQGVNKGIFKDDGTGKTVRTNPELTLTKKFSKGTEVDATYISGRMGSQISFVEDGGLLPSGEEHKGEVTYTLRFEDMNFKKPIPVAEVIKKEEEFEEPTVEAQQRGEEKKIFTPNNVALGVIGLIAIFIALKATKVIK